MDNARRLTLHRESLAPLTGDDLVTVVGAALPDTRERCLQALSADEVCPPTFSIAAPQCIRTLNDSSCACAGG